MHRGRRTDRRNNGNARHNSYKLIPKIPTPILKRYICWSGTAASPVEPEALNRRRDVRKPKKTRQATEPRKQLKAKQLGAVTGGASGDNIRGSITVN